MTRELRAELEFIKAFLCFGLSDLKFIRDQPGFGLAWTLIGFSCFVLGGLNLWRANR